MSNSYCHPGKAGGSPGLNSFPIDAGYLAAQGIDSVAAPFINCEGCQGLDFGDQNNDNESLIAGTTAT